MDSIKKALENWMNELNNFSFKDYEALPDLDLYMDQVIQFLDKQLYIFQTSTMDKQITPSMINNYVKGEVLPSPIAKKYNKEHLALIEEICTLKQVLSIAEVKQIIDSEYKDSLVKAEIFNKFNRLNNEKIEASVLEAFKHLNDIEENDTQALTELAMDFAMTANTYIQISKRILYLIRAYEIAEKAKEAMEKRKEKKDKKDEKDDALEDNASSSDIQE
jgi:DNA-binding transcriptional MerR regulator